MISSTGNAWSPRIPTVNSRPGINFSTRISGPNRATSAIAASISRSEEHTSELQSQSNLVCRLLLEKKKDPLRQHPPAPLHTAVSCWSHIVAPHSEQALAVLFLLRLRTHDSSHTPVHRTLVPTLPS